MICLFATLNSMLKRDIKYFIFVFYFILFIRCLLPLRLYVKTIFVYIRGLPDLHLSTLNSDMGIYFLLCNVLGICDWLFFRSYKKLFVRLEKLQLTNVRLGLAEYASKSLLILINKNFMSGIPIVRILNIISIELEFFQFVINFPSVLRKCLNCIILHFGITLIRILIEFVYVLA